MKTLLLLWQLVWKTLASIIIFLAVLAGAGKMLLPQVGHARAWVEHWLSQKLQQPIHIGALEGEWRGPGPELHLKNLRILGPDDEALLDIDQIDVVFSLPSLFTSQSRFIQFVLRGTTLEIRRDEDGQFQFNISGLTHKGRQPAQTGAKAGPLTRLGSLRLVNSRLVVHWSDDAFPLVFDDVAALYTQSSKKIWAAARLVPLGEDAPVDIRLRHIFAEGRTDLYLHTAQLNLLPWAPPLLEHWTHLRGGKLNLQAWATLERGRLADAWARFSVENIGLESPEAIRLQSGQSLSPRYWRSRLGGSLHYRKTAGGHDLSLLDFYSEGGNEVEDHFKARLYWNAQQAQLAVARLRLDRLDQLLRATRFGDALEHWLPYESNPGGMIVSAKTRFDPATARLTGAEAQLRALELSPSGKLPGFSGLNADLQYRNGQWQYQLSGQQVRIDYPRMFRDTLRFSTLLAEGRFERDEQGWSLDTEPLTLLNEDLQVQARLYLRGKRGQKRPFADAQAEIRQFRSASAWKYWPANIFKPKLLAWLDQALLDGGGHASFVLHGDLNHFPFRQQEGRFNFMAGVEDVQLRFHPQWPVGLVRSAELEFDRTAMRIHRLEGEVAGVQVTQAQGGIANYRHALLQLDMQGKGTAEQARDLLARSPVHKLYASQDEQFIVQGNLRTRLRLKVPLSPRAKQKKTTVDGRLTLLEGRLDLPQWEQHFQQLEGDLHYSETGFDGQGLRAQTLNRFVEINLCVAGHCDDPAQALQAELKGQFPMESMIRQARVADNLIPFMPGESQWQVQVNLPRSGLAHLDARSNLVGVTSLLPAPLNKTPDQAVPLQLALDLPPQSGQLDLRFGSQVRLQVRQPGQANQCLVLLGEPESIPDILAQPRDSMVLRGQVDELDLSGWLAIRSDLFGQPTAQNRPWLQHVNIETRHLRLLQHDMEQTRLELRQDNGFWKARLEGERMQGEIQASIYPGPDDTLIADFERIAWPRPNTDQLEALGKEAQQHSIRVSEIPRLHLLAEDFQLGNIDLGQIRLEAYPIADGLRIERVQARSDQLSLNASGDWLEDGQRTHSQFQIHLGVQSLGKLLARLGYANLIQGGQTVANFDVNWPGPPTAFALERLGGNLEIQVGPGQILEIQPGAGRIFGLLSLQQLPRRLLLDFRDVFNRGLSFDKITGHFRLERGVAYTDDLEMSSRTAKILLSGKTDLANQQYDQTIVVLPHVGQALPMVGALTGGVAGAAAMLAVQGLIGKSLDESNGVVYRLTGPWSDPDIQRLALKKRGKAQKSAKEAPPATGTPAHPTPDKG